MSNYEMLAQIRVNEALQEGLESQRASRARTTRPSRIKGMLKSVIGSTKRRFLARSASDTRKLPRSAKRIEA